MTNPKGPPPCECSMCAQVDDQLLMTTLQTIPTPLVDTVCWCEDLSKGTEVVLADFARKLERALHVAKAGLKHVTEHYAEESPDRIAEDALQGIEELLKP